MKNLNLYINTDELADILKSIHKLIKVKVSLFNLQNEEIYSYPKEQSCFCEMVRANKMDCCNASDAYGCSACLKMERVVSYQCHAGLIETVVPLKQNGRILGFVMFGQMLPSKDLPAIMDEFCKKFGYLCDEKFLREALSALIVWDKEELKAATKLINICVSYLLTHRIVFAGNSQIVKQLNAYIDDQLDNNLTPEMICEYFSISRTTLYTLSKQLLGGGIMAYIRKRRIEVAKQLISTTDLSLAQIADRVGFNDYNYFLKVFKQYEGVTCKEYKQEILKQCNVLASNYAQQENDQA